MSEGLSSSEQFPLAGFNSATAKPDGATTSDSTAAAGRDTALEPRHAGHFSIVSSDSQSVHAMQGQDVEAEGRPPYIHVGLPLFVPLLLGAMTLWFLAMRGPFFSCVFRTNGCILQGNDCGRPWRLNR